MATYRITAPNGLTYQIDGPDGASQADVINAVLAQYPDAGKARTQEKEATFLGGLGAAFKNMGASIEATKLSVLDRLADPEGNAEEYLQSRGLSSNSMPDMEETRKFGEDAKKGYSSQIKESQNKLRLAQEELRRNSPEYANPVVNSAYQGLQSLVQNTPGLALGVATRNPEIPLAAAYVQSSSQQYGNVRARGGSPEAARLAGTVTGATEVATEFTPTGYLVDKFGKTGASKFIAEFLAKDLKGELIATNVQDAVDYAIGNPQLTPKQALDQYLATRVEANLQTAVGTAVQAGAVGAVHKGIERFAQKGGDRPEPEATPTTPATPSATDAEQAIIDRLVASGATEEDAAKVAKRNVAQAVESGIVRAETPAASPAPTPTPAPASTPTSSASPTMGAMRVGPTNVNEAAAALPPIAPPPNPNAPMKERIAQVTQSVQETAQAAGVEITPKQTNVIAQQVARGKDPEQVINEVVPEAAAAIKETAAKLQEQRKLAQVEAATAALDPTNPAVQAAPVPTPAPTAPVATPPIAAITPTPEPQAPVETPKVEAPKLTQRRVSNGVFMVSKGDYNFVVEKNPDGTWGLRLPEQEKQLYTFKDKRRAVGSAEAMADSFAAENVKPNVSQEVEAQSKAVPEDATPEVQQAPAEVSQPDTPAPPEASPEAVADKPVADEAGPAEQRAPDDFERLKAETEAEHPYEVVYRPGLKKPYELYERKEDGTRERVARSTSFDNFREKVSFYTRPKTDENGNPITYVPEGVAGGVKRGGARTSQRDSLAPEDVYESGEAEPELTPAQLEQGRIYSAVTLAHQQGQITDQQYATLRDMLRPEEVMVQGSDTPVIRRTDPDKVLQQLTSFKLENKGAPKAAAPKANTRGANFTETRESAAAFKAEQAARAEKAKGTVGRILLERQISEEDKADLAKEYGEPEFNESALSRFANDFVDYINGVKRSFSKVVERVIKSVQAGVMSAMVVFSPAQLQPIQNFQLLPENQQESTITYEVRDPVPEVAKQQMSPLAQKVYERVAHTAMAKGKGFFIADKPNGMIHAFDAKGEYLSSSAALYGKQAGDVVSEQSMSRTADEMTDEDRVTPAGTFSLRQTIDPEYTGGYTFRMTDAKTGRSMQGIAVHAVYVGTPKEQRLQRLDTKSAADNKISFGCINTGNKFFLDEVLPHAGDFNGGLVFVLPDDTASTDAYFPAETRTVKERPANEGVSTETPAQTQDERGLPREQRQQLQAQRRAGRRRDGRGVDEFNDTPNENAPTRRSVADLPHDLREYIEGIREQLPSLTRHVDHAVRLLEQGKIDEGLFTAMVASYAQDHGVAREIKRIEEQSRDRTRGVDFVRQRLLEGRRRGWLDPEGVDLADWFLTRNPQAAEDLAISLPTPAENSRSSGQYSPLQRLVTIFKGNDKPTTAVHEVLHHTERMMPLDVQNGIRSEWLKQFQQALRDAANGIAYDGGDLKKVREYLDLLTQFHEGVDADGRELSQKELKDISNKAMDLLGDSVPANAYYPLFNSSEFWATRAADIMGGRYQAFHGPVRNRARQWLMEFAQKVRGIFGLRSDAPILKGLKAVTRGDGSFQRGAVMLGQAYVYNAPPNTAAAKAIKKTKVKINKAARQAQLSVEAMGDKDSIAAAEEFAKAVGDVAEAHTPDGASLADWLKATDLATVRTVMAAYPTSSIVDLTKRTISEVGAKADAMVKIMQKKVGEAQSMLAGSERIVRELNKYASKSSSFQSNLAMAISTARRGRVDVENLPSTLAEALAQDPGLKHIEQRSQDPNLNPKQKAALTKSKNSRTADVTAAFKAWEQLGKNEGGHAAFKRMRQYYKDMYDLTRMHLDERIEGLDISDDAKRKLMAQIRAEQEEVKGASSQYDSIPDNLLPEVYFPFQRHGEYWLRVGKGETGRELHFFDNVYAREKYIRKREADAKRRGVPFENVQSGTGLDELRSDFVENTAMLKKMFEIIDKAKSSTKTDLDKLKNQLYQTWLLTSPERSVRRQFLHADLVTGESADVLRNFRTTAVQYANQISALKYDDKLMRVREEAEALREGYDDRLKMDKAQALMDIIADRFTKDYSDSSKSVDFINRLSFLYYLTGAATAITQPTAIPIRVAPHLAARYGYGKTTAALMRYMPFWKTVGMTETLLDGSKVWVAPNMERSAMIRNNPIRRKAIAEGRMRGVFQTTTAALLHGDATPKGVAARTGHGANRVFWETTTGLFNASELLSRQMTYMAAFDLAYAKTKNFEAAVDEAVKATNETMGDYNTYDTPKIARNAPGRVLFLFKRYAANTTRFFLNNAREIFTGPNKVQALHELSGVILMGAMFHGIAGQPLYGLICAVIDLISKAWDDDEDKKRRAQNPLFADNADARFRFQWLPKFFGDYEMPGLDGRMHSLNKVLELGPISELTDVNIGSRTSFSGMWFRDGAPADSPEQALINTFVANVPVLSMGVSVARAAKDWDDGRILKGLEKVSPAFTRGMLAAARINSEGVETSHGEKIVRRDEINDLNLAAQVLGFQSTQVADLSKQHYAIQQQKQRLTSERTKLMRHLNDALFNEERGDGDIEKAADKIRKWNETYGSVPFLVITNAQVASSIKNFGTNRAMSYRGTTFTKKEATTVIGALLGEDPWATEEE